MHAAAVATYTTDRPWTLCDPKQARQEDAKCDVWAMHAPVYLESQYGACSSACMLQILLYAPACTYTV
jgi:hypothetical protein